MNPAASVGLHHVQGDLKLSSSPSWTDVYEEGKWRKDQTNERPDQITIGIRVQLGGQYLAQEESAFQCVLCLPLPFCPLDFCHLLSRLKTLRSSGIFQVPPGSLHSWCPPLTLWSWDRDSPPGIAQGCIQL